MSILTTVLRPDFPTTEAQIEMPLWGWTLIEIVYGTFPGLELTSSADPRIAAEKSSFYHSVEVGFLSEQREARQAAWANNTH